MKYKNAEGYSDPTAGIALSRVTKEERNVHDLIHIFRLIANLAGFEIVGRITLKNRKTGVTYK